MGLALLDQRVGDACAVKVRGGNLGPLVNTVEDGECHAAVDVGLNVAVEEESTGSLDLVAEGDPGRVALCGWGSVAISDCCFVSDIVS